MQRTISVIAVAAFAGSAYAVVVNGGFEAGTGPDADNWNQLEIFGGTQGANSIVDRTTANVHTGQWAMNFEVTGAPDYGPVAEIQQVTSVGSVVAGQAYDFSFWAAGTPGPGSVGFYEVLWFDADGSNGGGPQGSATGLQNIGYGAAYAQFGMTGLIAPTGADSVLVQIRLVTGAFDGAAGQMSVDDVTFAAVPAPATAGLLALGGIAAVRRRR